MFSSRAKMQSIYVWEKEVCRLLIVYYCCWKRQRGSTVILLGPTFRFHRPEISCLASSLSLSVAVSHCRAPRESFSASLAIPVSILKMKIAIKFDELKTTGRNGKSLFLLKWIMTHGSLVPNDRKPVPLEIPKGPQGMIGLHIRRWLENTFSFILSPFNCERHVHRV